MPHKDKEARQAYHTNYYLSHKNSIKNRSKEYYESHKEKSKQNTVRWIEANFEYQLYRNAKSSARSRELEFSISREDIIIPEYCPYLGIKLTRFVNGGRQETNASLDRIDNAKGYIKGNIQVISSKANFMKRNASIEELVIFAKNIINKHC